MWNILMLLGVTYQLNRWLCWFSSAIVLCSREVCGNNCDCITIVGTVDVIQVVWVVCYWLIQIDITAQADWRLGYLLRSWLNWWTVHFKLVMCLSDSRMRLTPIVMKCGLDPTSLTSYRPMSNLSALSIFLERFVANRLKNYLHTVFATVQLASTVTV